MRVTWTVKVSGFSGQACLCRDEKEAAQLVLKLFLAGVKRYQIIVDGQYVGQMDVSWIWKALDI